MPDDLSVVIHGHFYQPPREDPWLEVVEREESASPFHDWNERIEQECYRAVAAARIPGTSGRIARIINAYEWISFNFGPTLLEWLEHAAPPTYRAVLDADRRSLARLGHGNAIAMPYHHAILPLSSRREKVTEVRWGIADFRRRFGRAPEGMWLPETAVDEETLDVLAAEGIRFTILAPSQVTIPPAAGRPGLVRTAGGRSIAVCLYDGPISHDVAFGPLVRDADAWAVRLLDRLAPPEGDDEKPADIGPRLAAVATDGETYGHHHAFGEMALARVLDRLRQHDGIRIENFASLLARHPATEPVTLVTPSAWSCAHGVERWRSDCGCKIDPARASQQGWRRPLRDGLAWLAGECHALYDREAPAYLDDPAAALDGYGAVIGQPPEASRAYAAAAARPGVGADGITRAVELLELERGALRSLTSCAWFFDDIGGIEALQVLRYAAWAIAGSGQEARRLETGLLRHLAEARSNNASLGTGRDIFLRRARPHSVSEARVAAGLAAVRCEACGAEESPGYRLEHEGGLVLVRRRTGRRYPFSATVESADGSLRVTIAAPWLAEPITYGLTDLPEPQRVAVGALLRGQLLRRLLTPHELEAVARGEELRPVVRRALVRAVTSLGADAGPTGRHQVVELLELLEELGQAVPFEVQTVFYRIWHDGRSGDAGLAELANRLGFVTTTPAQATPKP
jgi:uncharacterized protein DUF3536/glycosyl hydrolase family 57